MMAINILFDNRICPPYDGFYHIFHSNDSRPPPPPENRSSFENNLILLSSVEKKGFPILSSIVSSTN